MKALITGGAGFIGYHLARWLRQATPDTELVLADNLQRGRMDADFKALLEEPNVEFLNLDLTDPSAYEQLPSGFEQVYHLAAVNGTDLFYKIPDQVLRTNLLSLIYMLDWFKEKNKDGKFCFTSSNEAYAGGLIAFNALPIPTPENVPLVIADTYNPRWSYAASKLAGGPFVINIAPPPHFFGLLVFSPYFY